MSLQQKEVCKTCDHKLQATYSYPLTNYAVDYTVIHVVIGKSALSERNNSFPLQETWPMAMVLLCMPTKQVKPVYVTHFVQC
jgi:uncharacterized protein (DUF983 family)